jgi:uncharacterized membrane protein
MQKAPTPATTAPIAFTYSIIVILFAIFGSFSGLWASVFYLSLFAVFCPFSG